MKKYGSQLNFISWIKRNGSGTVKIGTPWNKDAGQPKCDTVDHLSDESFFLNPLSLTYGTYIASGFNTYVVTLKTKNK